MKKTAVFISILFLFLTGLAGGQHQVWAAAGSRCTDEYTDPNNQRKYSTTCVPATNRGTLVGHEVSYAGCPTDSVCWTGKWLNPPTPTTSGTCGDIYVDSKGKQYATYCSPIQGGGSQIPFTGCGGIDTCWTDELVGLQTGGVCEKDLFIDTNGDEYPTHCIGVPGLTPNLSGYIRLSSYFRCNTVGASCWAHVNEKKSAFNPKATGEQYDFCKQVPNGQQRDACLKCLQAGGSGNGKEVSGRIYTAVGCLNTSNEGLVRDVIRLLMGVAGTVALLSILGGAFLFSISQGDSNKVKQARELLTAAVSGLIFMIFSIIILQFVGVSILHIPGLSQ